ncbi:hypothetical protein EDD86DRAFT_250265 [Gorgonomyces haynaldii]|nr:hypothetical protein EDD86DRAFT_250265 [Gorgonomyces haynaldii]
MYHHVLQLCDSKLRKRKHNEALKELQVLLEKPDFEKAVPQAMILAHKSSKYVEAIQALEAKYVIADSGEPSDKQDYLLGLFYLYTLELKTARKTFQSILSRNNKNAPVLNALGWTEFQTHLELKSALSYFEKALEIAPSDLESQFGKFLVLRKLKHVQAALDMINHLAALYTQFLPAAIERMYTYLEISSWDQASEAAQRLVGIDQDNIDALYMTALLELLKEEGKKSALLYVQSLFQALVQKEPTNDHLFYTMCLTLSRISTERSGLQEEWKRFLLKSIELNPHRSEYHRDLERAHECFKNASKVDPQNQRALEGMIRWQLFNKYYEEAEEQLNIFQELQKAVEASAELHYLNGYLHFKYKSDYPTAMTFFHDALMIQTRYTRQANLSTSLYLAFNPGFVLEIAHDYLQCTELSSLQSVQDALETILRMVPSSSMSLFYLAKLKLMQKDLTGAEIQVQMANEQYQQALSSLDMALGYDFEIRHQPQFYLLKAKCQKMQDSVQDAIKTLENAFALSQVKESLANMTKKKGKQNAKRLMDEANRRFAGTPEEQNFFLAAKSKLADIYLKHKKDRKMFAECYKQIVDIKPSPEACILLGDAYLTINEPDLALTIYQSALNLKQSFDTTAIRSKIGKALVLMHDFEKACKFYSAATEHLTEDELGLLQDYSTLLLDLGRPNDALAVIESGKQGFEKVLTKLKTLYATVWLELGDKELALRFFEAAKELSLANAGPSGSKAEASEIALKVADMYEHQTRDLTKAAELYREAVQYQPKNAALSLAKVYIKMNDWTAAQTQLTGLLQAEDAPEEASMIMGDLLCEQLSFAAAGYHYMQLSVRFSPDFEAFSKYIDICRRIDKLEDVDVAYLNQINLAMKQFVLCRRDAIFGERATHQLIELFLNPENQTIGGEALESAVETPKEKDWQSESELVSILTADQLLKDLTQSTKSLRTQVMECFTLMASKQKSDIERAVNTMMDLLTTERDYIPALHGGKYDLATELLKKVTNVNKSCTKAWEYLGFIMEKESSYKDAADHYSQCWKLQKESNAAIGFKLAFNYLKAKRYCDAIDVCHRVLESHPDYPKIRKELLDKARAALRYP